MSEPISTGCGSVDALLGGGLERGVVTQVYGPPASGKTNVALSSTIQVAAAGGTALYIDTEGISLDRFEALAKASADGDDIDAITGRVIISDAVDFEEQREAVRDAGDLSERVDLIVLDSATGFYRLERDDDDDGRTLRTVAKQITHLLALARRHDIAVLITNQVYSDPETDSGRSRPLGGHTLTHWSGVVLRLERFRGGNRRITLEKHRSKAAGETARFRITETGIESVDDAA
ncbi:MAG: DNA repair and recombination protein RadB [Halobacteriota archaeon]|uniref:DNA repair and recombination protein RadB n=1 Tax=Natronomonas sp. TaxID=2184060 RepID=UPI0039753FAF